MLKNSLEHVTPKKGGGKGWKGESGGGGLRVEKRWVWWRKLGEVIGMESRWLTRTLTCMHMAAHVGLPMLEWDAPRGGCLWQD